MEKEFLSSLITIFDRDLLQLKKEIESYASEASLWKLCGEIKTRVEIFVCTCAAICSTLSVMCWAVRTISATVSMSLLPATCRAANC